MKKKKKQLSRPKKSPESNKVDESVVQELKDFQSIRLSHSRPMYQFNSAYNGEIRSLTTYIEYCFRKFNQFVDIPTDSEDYEIHLALPNIRNKLFAVLYRIAAQRMKSEFFPQNVDQPFDKIIAKYIRSLAEWSDEQSQQLMVIVAWLFETCLKGTGILCEDYYKHTREIPDVKIHDSETGKSKWRKKKIVEDKCYSFVIPLEEFYVWDIKLPFYRIQEQYKLYWETVMKWDDFQTKFKKYPNANTVKKAGIYRTENEPFYNENLKDLEDDEVRVLRIWCREKCSFKIIAGDQELTEEDNPIPYKHGMFPVIPLIYEMIQFDFFYGKSFVDKNGNLSDAIDQLFNDTFNLNQIEMKAPLVAKQGSVLQDSKWRADSILWYTGEKPEPLQVSRQGAQNTDRLHAILKNQMDLSSVSDTFGGQTGSGSTAREIILAQENTLSILNGLVMVLEWGEWMRMQMRISNILQFQTTPLLSEGVANGQDFQGAYREIIQHNVELDNGKMGTRKILIMPQSKMSSFSELEKKQSDSLEIAEIDAQFIRNLSLYIRVIPNSSVKISQTLKKALDIEFTKLSIEAFPDLANRQELYRQLIEDFDKSPEKLILEQQPMDMTQQLEKMFAPAPGGPGGAPTSQKMLNSESVLSNMV